MMIDFAKRILPNLHSKVLYGNQTTILLGSGASVHYLPGTTQVTNDLKTWSKYYMPRDSRMTYTIPQDVTGYDGSPGQEKYFQRLYDYLSPSYENPQQFLHFERLIHVAQGLDRHTQSVVNKSNDFLKMGVGPLTPIASQFTGLDNEIHAGIASDACTYILDTFAEKEKAAKEQGVLNSEPLNEFLKKLSCDKYLRLYTLNYDTLPLHSGIDFVSGFRKRESSSTAESFYPTEIKTAYRKNLFCQLHGSNRFGYNVGSQTGAQGLIVRFPDHQSALHNRYTTLAGNHYTQDGIENLSQLMITGLRKADAILHEPFATYFSQLFEDLVNSDTILIVGYSGGDTHVNQIFKRAHAYREEMGLKTKMIWVGYVDASAFDGNGEARMQINDEPWQALGNSRSLLPDKFIENMRPLLSYRHILYRNLINEFENKNIRVGYCFQGSPNVFNTCGDELLSFLNQIEF